MKNVKVTMIMAMAFLSLSVLSCKDQGKETKGTSTEATTDHQDHNMEHKEGATEQGKEYTSAYVCPMHCEGSGSDTEGKCPKCGMDYVKNEDAGHEGHGS